MNNRLVEYYNKMNTSYSYKTVLIVALVEFDGQVYL